MVNEEDKAKSKKDLLGDNNANRNMGTRRLNRMPLLILTLIGGIVVAGIGYTFYTKSNSSSSSKKDDDKRPAPASASNLLANAPLAGLIDGNKVSIDDPTSTARVKQKAPPPPPVVTTPQIPAALQKQLDALLKPPEPKPVVQVAPPPPVPQLSEYEKQLIALEKARQAALNSAIHAGTTVGGITPPKTTASKNASAVANNQTGFGSASTAENKGDDGSKDPNKQQQKREFLNQKPDQGSDYLPNSRMQPLTPYEVKAGTIIPSVMISGVNSDLPGQLIAQVAENVYDTAKGEFILIPQGARLVGSFDNGVSMGQQRVLVVWNRIIYPDASSVDLNVMSASDQAGYSGMSDQVDNHYVRTFGSAFLLSILSAASQLSQPNTNNNNNDNNSTFNTAQQTAAAALGQQLTQLGTQIISKNLDIAPTLTIRPGYKFIIMVNKDIQLTPWPN